MSRIIGSRRNEPSRDDPTHDDEKRRDRGLSGLLDRWAIALWANEIAAGYGISAEFRLGTLTDAPEKGRHG